MKDIFMIVLMMVTFGILWGFIRWCDRTTGGGEKQ